MQTNVQTNLLNFQGSDRTGAYQFTLRIDVARGATCVLMICANVLRRWPRFQCASLVCVLYLSKCDVLTLRSYGQRGTEIYCEFADIYIHADTL